MFEEKKLKRKINSESIKKYNVPHNKLKSLQNGADWINLHGEVISYDILTEAIQPFRYAFCSDTRFNTSIIEKIKGVDLLYHESTFTKDLKTRAEETGHSTTIDAANIAKLASVRKLLLGHYSQRYKDINVLLDEALTVFDNSILSYSGW